MKWTLDVNYTTVDISGTLYTDTLGYKNYKQTNIKSSKFTDRNAKWDSQYCKDYLPCEFVSTPSGPPGSGAWQKKKDGCPEPAINDACESGTKPIFHIISGDNHLDSRPTFFCSECTDGHCGRWNICNTIVCYQCYCDKNADVACAQEDFNMTMGLTAFNVDALVKYPDVKVPVLSVKQIDGSWKNLGTDMASAKKGSVGVSINNNFTDNFVLDSKLLVSIQTWVEQWKTVKTVSSNPDPIIPTLFYKYFKYSIFLSAIFMDFFNQFYRRFKDEGNRPSLVKKFYQDGDINFWIDILDNSKCYVHEMVNSMFINSTQSIRNSMECLLNFGNGSSGVDGNGQPISGFVPSPIVGVPLPSKTTNADYILTMTLSVNDYNANKSNIGVFCTNLINNVLKDQEVLYNGKPNQHSGPVFVTNTTFYPDIFIQYKIGNGSKTGSITSPTVSFANITDQESNDYYINYILAVKVTLVVSKWSPMLLLYFINTNKSFIFDIKDCGKIASDTNNIIPRACLISYKDDKQQFLNLEKYCTIDMSFGNRSGNFNLPKISEQLVISSSDICACVNGRIAPVDLADTEVGINSNLCYNKLCKATGNRDKFINAILGNENKCKNYCSDIYKWLSEGKYMQHSNEIDTDLFRQYCGDFKPTNPSNNTSVLIVGIIMTILASTGIGLTTYNKKLPKILVLLFVILLLGGGIGGSIFLSSELSGQNWIDGPVGGPYKKVCESKRFSWSLPSEFCPDDLGAECLFDQDCKDTNCNAGCIAQICTPGPGQVRTQQYEYVTYVPYLVIALCVSIFIFLPIILFQGVKLTKFIPTPKLTIIISICISIITVLPVVIISNVKHRKVKYAEKCTPKPPIKNVVKSTSSVCNLTQCS